VPEQIGAVRVVGIDAVVFRGNEYDVMLAFEWDVNARGIERLGIDQAISGQNP